MLGLHYCTNGVWGTGIGTLTPAQVDENFWLCSEGLRGFNFGSPVTISGLSQASLDEFTVSLSNGHTDGPFPLTSMVWTWQGLWLPHTVYEAGDVFWFRGSIYQVLANHTSASTFSAGANNGQAQDYYKLTVTFDDDVLPIAGVTGAALTKASGASFDTAWTSVAAVGLPAHGTEGQWLTRITSPANAAIWETNVKLNDPSIQQDGSFLLSVPNVYFECSNTHLLNIQIPPHAVNSLPIGSQWHFYQKGTAQIEITVLFPHITTLTGIEGFANKTARTGALMTLKKVAAETYHLFGFLAPA